MKYLVVVFALACSYPVSAQTEETKERMVRTLSHQKVTVRFDRTPLEDVLDYFRDVSGLNFVVDRRLSHVPEITLHLTNIRLKSALRLMLGTHGLTATYREGSLWILSQERAHAKVLTRVYDVHDLLLKIRDFPGPNIQLSEKDSGIDPGDWSDLDPPKERVDRDLLVDLISANTGGASWEENGNTSIGLVNGLLIVAQSPKVHVQIGSLLNRLRSSR